MRQTVDGEVVDETERGRLVGHCSEEDGVADVGASIGLGDGRLVWIGEISSDLYEEAKQQAAGADIGDGSGYWIVLFGKESKDTVVIGKLADPYMAREALEGLLLTLTNGGSE